VVAIILQAISAFNEV